MNHVDIFTGIGGFILAAQTVWGDEYENVLCCDNNAFCREVLRKNFGKEILIYEEIKDVTRERVTADTYNRRQAEEELKTAGNKQCDRGAVTNAGKLKSRRVSDIKRKENPKIGKCYIDLLTGGFPCQPFSQAGQRRGTEDDRFLWPEMFRIIKEFKPKWIIAENVSGILTIEGGLVFEQVCLDLEAEGYSVQPFIIPAVACNAPHRRDRVWIVAYSKHIREFRAKETGQDSRLQCKSKTGEKLSINESTRTSGLRTEEFGRHKNTTDTKLKRPIQCKPKKRTRSGERIFEGGNSDATDAENKGLERKQHKERGNSECGWEQNWLEVATELCGVDDGLPVKLDGFKLTKAGHRVERLKALGNAILPQNAIEIMEGIKSTK